MQVSIAAIVGPAELARVRDALAEARFVDGRRTAGWAAAPVKNNLQAEQDPALEDLTHEIVARITANPVFELAARPKRIINATFSRYGPGNAYGTHVDNALMAGERTDVSFTLFLSDPGQYDGGELIIESTAGEDAIKLEAGSLFAYPSTTLHRVAPVTRGERLALVGWVRSYIRDAAKRELLFDLETARRGLFDRHGKTQEFDLLSKTAANLLRMWAED
jgi:PKHD-type hydroxylase